MASIRAQLATAYAATLVCTVAVVGGLVYEVEREVQRQDAAHQIETRARSDVDVSLRLIEQAAASGTAFQATAPVVVLAPGRPGVAAQPPGVIPTPGGAHAAPSSDRGIATLGKLLEGVPDFVVVLDSNGRMLYVSFAARQLDPDDQFELAQTAMRLPLTGGVRPIELSGRRYLLAVGAPSAPQAGVGRVVAGVDMSETDVNATALLAIDLILLPVVVLLSIAGVYAVSGRAFQPVDVIINEVEAISDGRSLHRRLVVDGAGDEMRRLSETLNQMIARLESSFGALRRFTADASHELKTPLTVLRADVERAMTSPSHSTEQLIALEEALQETRRMADLVDSLLTLARADEGRYDMMREPVPLDPLVREVFESALILGEDAGLTVSLLVLEPVTVLGDATRLRQLFMNLVMNAVKYTPRGGRVEISLSHRLDGVTFSVRDTGIGIAPSDLSHIFERFWRADRVRSRASERGGFGLGLAISQWIAQAHGGSIAATSRVGRGSTFTVHLATGGREPESDVHNGSTGAVASGTI
jgi:two-component system OmpR family sensor kinase